MKKNIILILLLLSIVFIVSACDPYKNYTASGLEAKSIEIDYETENGFIGENRVELISDYDSYAAYNFKLDYSKTYFELNNLLVFSVRGCSSDEIEFVEILEKDGTIYPLFSRNKILDGQAVTDDIILMSYCVELSKETEYKIGEIIYRYN